MQARALPTPAARLASWWGFVALFRVMSKAGLPNPMTEHQSREWLYGDLSRLIMR